MFAPRTAAPSCVAHHWTEHDRQCGIAPDRPSKLRRGSDIRAGAAPVSRLIAVGVSTSNPTEIRPLVGIGEVSPGEDLVALVVRAFASADIRIASDDILVVTSKILSKAEGRIAWLDAVSPGEQARRLAEVTRKDARLVELVLSESIAVVRAAPNVLITRHRLGLVMANAGIDQSNLGPGEPNRVLLLPTDPDASAAHLRRGLAAACGNAPAVVISDSFGRPWRNGVVNVAIGCSGLPALVDRRGERDRDGRVMQVTEIALADMIATAAGLVCGEGAEGVPAALIRNYPLPPGDAPATTLIRSAEQDLFR